MFDLSYLCLVDIPEAVLRNTWYFAVGAKDELNEKTNPECISSLQAAELLGTVLLLASGADTNGDISNHMLKDYTALKISFGLDASIRLVRSVYTAVVYNFKGHNKRTDSPGIIGSLKEIGETTHDIYESFKVPKLG